MLIFLFALDFKYHICYILISVSSGPQFQEETSMQNIQHPSHPGLWLNKPRPNTPDADGYDDIGDPWWFCEIHQEWWDGYCTGCHPVMHKSVTIGAAVVEVAIVAGFALFLISMLSH